MCCYHAKFLWKNSVRMTTDEVRYAEFFNYMNIKVNIKKIDFFWLSLFTLIFLVEFFLFKTYVTREITPYYPIAFDQSEYLQLIYSSYERVLSKGVLQGLSNTITPNSIIFIPQVVLFLLIFGASRFNALLFNFFYFLILQIFVIYTAKWLSGKYSVGVVALALLLSIGTPFFWAGGLTDIRIDFVAFCLYGIFVSSVIRSEVFLITRWSIVASLVASILVLTRCLTVVYIFLTLACIWGYITLVDRKNYPNQYKIRFKNIIIFVALFFVISFPFLWINKYGLYQYYFVSSIVHEHSIRAAELGIKNISGNIFFYPVSMLRDHVGITAIWLIFFLFLISVCKIFFKKRSLSSKGSIFGHPFLFVESDKLLYIFVITTFVIPLFVLMLNPSKSPVVVSITVIPLIWIVLLAFIRFGKMVIQKETFCSMLSVIFLSLGLTHYLRMCNYHENSSRNNSKIITKMYEDIGTYEENIQNTHPIFSADQVVEFLLASNLTDIYYEKYGKFLNVTTGLGGGSIFAVPSNEAEKIVKDSDIYITNIQAYPSSVYPFNIKIDEYRSVLRDLVKQSFILLGEYDYGANRFEVYVKPGFQIVGDSDGWITSAGVTLKIPAIVVKQASRLIISGNIDPVTHDWISENLVVQGWIVNKPKVLVNVKLEVINQRYVISCVVPKLSNVENTLNIHLAFAGAFIRKGRDIKDDTSRFLLSMPSIKKVVLQKN